MQFLFPNFLTDRQQYHEVESLWQHHWMKLLEHLGESGLWTSPWMTTTFGDGTPMLDGNPIFSAVSPGRGQGVRVIQLEPSGNTLEISAWADEVEDGTKEINELVIACVLTQETLLYAIDAMEQWITCRQVHIQAVYHQLVLPRLRSGPRALYVAPTAA